MSINDNQIEFGIAHNKAIKTYTRAAAYPNDVNHCTHNSDFTIYCDNEYDIVRCTNCGKEKVVKCTFDDDYS